MSFLSPNHVKSVSGEQINDPNQFPGLIISSSNIDFRQKGAALLCKSHCQCHYYNSYSYSATLILAVSLQLKKFNRIMTADYFCPQCVKFIVDLLQTVCTKFSCQLKYATVCSFLLNKISTNVLL